jgi:hypothetical protein
LCPSLYKPIEFDAEEKLCTNGCWKFSLLCSVSFRTILHHRYLWLRHFCLLSLDEQLRYFVININSIKYELALAWNPVLTNPESFMSSKNLVLMAAENFDFLALFNLAQFFIIDIYEWDISVWKFIWKDPLSLDEQLRYLAISSSALTRLNVNWNELELQFQSFNELSLTLQNFLLCNFYFALIS